MLNKYSAQVIKIQAEVIKMLNAVHYSINLSLLLNFCPTLEQV